MEVLDHNDSGIHHDADGDGDPGQRHDVRVDVQPAHGEKRAKDAQGQTDCGDQRRRQVQQERSADQDNQQQLTAELGTQIIDRPQDQVGAVVHNHEFDALGQTGGKLRETVLDPVDDFDRVLSPAHHDNTADRLALTVQIRCAAAHGGAESHFGHVAQGHGRTELAAGQGNALELVQARHIAGGPHHVLRLRHLDNRSASLLVAGLNALSQIGQRESEGMQALRIHDHLILTHHAAHGRHLGNTVESLELILQEPVLEAAQCRDVMLPAAVHQRVLKDPPDTGGVRSEARPCPRRQG